MGYGDREREAESFREKEKEIVREIVRKSERDYNTLRCHKKEDIKELNSLRNNIQPVKAWVWSDGVG